MSRRGSPRWGFDWLLLDAEHGPLGFETMHRMMQVMNGTTCTPLVRRARAMEQSFKFNTLGDTGSFLKHGARMGL